MSEENQPIPTIDELEAMLKFRNQPDIEIHPDGSLSFPLKVSANMLRVLMLTYLKHGEDKDVIGWGELRNNTRDMICEAIGEDFFCEWIKKVKERG